ncbi:MAG TPA: hypothetical protein VKH19_14410 [Gemmatimonadaceae bacterium]|nr:hypothetical protein [Gemmatimonadaceae bacterium]
MRSTAVVVSGLVALLASQAEAQGRPASNPPANTQRLQDTRAMHVACVAGDSARGMRRAVGLSDTSRLGQRMPGDTARAVTGGTARSHEYPEYDVVLDIPNLCVERIFLKVDSVTAKLNLHAQISNLVKVDAGADVLIGNVDLTVQDVRARALLLVDLDDVVHIVDQTLTFVDNHPEIIDQLGSTLQNTVGTVGSAVGGLVRTLVIGTTRLANGNVLQRVVDEATGSILEKTISAAGQVIAQRAVGSLLNLPTIRETTNTAGQLVRQVRDQTGPLIEYTLDKLTNKILGVRLLSNSR